MKFERTRLCASTTIASFLLALGVAAQALAPSMALAATFDASGLLGQTSYTADIANSPSGSINGAGFYGLASVTLDTVNHRLFVSDTTSNHRILVYPLDSNNNLTTTTPSYVLGACNFTTAGTGAVSTNTFALSNLAYDSTNSRLFVSVALQNRVLAFDVAPADISNCENALFVLGQPNFTSSTYHTTQSGLHTPDDIDFDSANSRLFVSDEGNNRVMVFSVPGNATSSINGENALFELGQADFTHYAGTTTQSGLHTPVGEAYDSVNNRLFVDDIGNSRVMAFSVPGNATSSINGENALFELGQPNFTSALGETTQSGLAQPDDDTYDVTGNRLFVSDTANNRIMVFSVPGNATSSINGENAQNNIGQSTWTGSSGGTTQSTFTSGESPHAYDAAHNTLYSYEGYGYRVLQFKMIHITTSSLPGGSGDVAYNQSISVSQNQGTSTTFSVESGSLPAGLSLDSSSGIISGTPTTPGSYTFTVEADDNFSTGPFFDRAAYTVAIATSAPTVAADAASSIALKSADLNGDITATGGEDPETRGFVYGTTDAYGATTTESGSFAAGAFDASLSSLACATAYHFAPYATNSAGTNYGDDTTFTTTGCPGNGPPVGLVGTVGAFNWKGSAVIPTLPDTSTPATTTSTAAAGLAAGLTASQVQSVLSLLASFGVDQHALAAVTVVLRGAPSTRAGAASPFTRDLTLWDTGPDILSLQQWLNAHGYPVAQSGPGSAGKETDTFGLRTYAALIKFQTVNNLPASGFFGALTRAAITSQLLIDATPTAH